LAGLGGGLGGGLVWRPGVLPLFAEERRGDRGKIAFRGGPISRGGPVGKATGEVMRGRRRREKGVGGPRRRGHSGLFLPLRAPGLADPAAPAASASARRNRRGKLSLWA
jgi:hypothetical protein